MQNELRLTLLGAPQIWLGNQAVHGFRTLKTQALFYYLAETRRAHTRVTLATLLWGDMPERNALVSLSKSLSNLRDLFHDYLEIDRRFVSFNDRAPYWLDVAAFEAGFSSGNGVGRDTLHASTLTHFYDQSSDGMALLHLRQSVDLYRGDFLAGFMVNHAPDFDAWQSTESQRLRELAIHGLDTLASGYATLGNWAEAIRCCRRILVQEPWREKTHRLLMSLLVANEERGAALVQYELCARTLHNELAVELDPLTTELYKEIAAGRFGVEDARRQWKAQMPTLPIGLL